MVGHGAPDGFQSRTNGALENGEVCNLDFPALRFDFENYSKEIKTRLSQWIVPTAKYTSGVLAKYSKTVSSASKGAVTW